MSKHSRKQSRNKGEIGARKKKKRFNYKILIFLIIIIICIIIIKKNNLIEKTILVFNPITIQSLEIHIEKNEIEINELQEVTTSIYPNNYSQSDLQWHSSNSEVIEVIDGKILGKSVRKSYYIFN